MKAYYHITTQDVLNMPIREFFRDIGGMYNTKFNEIVRIRTTTNEKRIKDFSDGEKEIYRAWKKHKQEEKELYKIPQKKLSKEEELRQGKEIESIFISLAQ